MDQRERELLENTFNLAKENNEILRKMRRAQKIADFMRFMYWIIIIGVTIGAFYFMQPYIEQMKGLIEKAGISINSFNNLLPKK